MKLSLAPLYAVAATTAYNGASDSFILGRVRELIEQLPRTMFASTRGESPILSKQVGLQVRAAAKDDWRPAIHCHRAVTKGRAWDALLLFLALY